ncbi:type I polyketide synthase, partial [Frankia tisae]
MKQEPSRLLAVVGMAGRFPGAPDVDSFWRLLVDRGDAIRPVPADRWDRTAQLDPEKVIQDVGGFLDDVGDFDATFFGISPREAVAIDPQHRLMLETAWRTLEDAGTRAASLAGTRTGVYIGSSWHDYELLRKDRGAAPTQHSAFGTAMDMAATRVSYFLGLTGPSLAVETGCSSSLVALHLAGQALLAGEIDAALVGGVNLILSPEGSVGLTHFGGLSPTGRCQAFAATADGFVRGEGVAAVYVKTLARALADGDRIRGVIARTAVNNDGGGESLVTPNPSGQEDLLRTVYEDSDIPLDQVAYVEAHGTGTGRGDPVEAGAIGRALGVRRSPDAGPLPIGSVKTNIGHLEPAAGMAGLVKALLALEHRVVPPSLFADNPHPGIPFGELNLRLTGEPVQLPADAPVFLGVNSFGWGGTNAHVVITDPPPAAHVPASPAAQTPAAQTPVLLALSAQTDAALTARAHDVRATLAPAPADGGASVDSGAPADGGGTVGLPALAGTLAWRRDQFASRLAVLATTAAGAAAALDRFAAGDTQDDPDLLVGKARAAGRTAFVFPGQGSQWAAMGRDLLATDPTFAATVDRCAAALRPHVDWDLRELLAGAAGDEWLARVDQIQPALWAVSVALAEVWRAAGVEPDVVIGHSQGEVGAATVAGILSYDDAALIVARRAAIVRRTSGRGHMLAVDLDVDAARVALEGFEEVVALAVNNGPRSCVLSGDGESVLVLKELLEADGTFCRLVNVDYASHSPQMDELREDLLAALAPVRPRAGDIPLKSTVRGTLLAGPELDAAYWVDNLRQPVMFADALADLFDEGVTHVVEISPHPVLAPAVEELAGARQDPPQVVTTLRRDEGTAVDLAHAFGRAYVAGLEPFGRLPRDAWAPAPGYPWQRRTYWVEAGRGGPRRAGALDVALTPSVTESDVWTGALELARDDTPWFVDHRVFDAVVLPGVGMLALALATARARTGAVPGALTDVEFRSDLTFGDDALRVSVLWRDDVSGGGSFALSSLPAGATDWTTHATARVHHGAAAPAGVPSLDDPVSPADPAFPGHLLAGEPGDPEEFYAVCAARGLNYGPSFRGLRRLFQSGPETDDGTGAEALGEVVLPERCRAGARPDELHPALWDAALQVALSLTGGDGAVVPRSVDRVRMVGSLAEPPTALWSHAVRRDPTRLDFHVFDANRRLLLTMEGLRMEVLPDAPGEVGAGEWRDYRLEFTEQPPAADAAELTAAAGTWAIVAGPGLGDTARELAEALTARGVTPALTDLADPAAPWSGAPTQVVVLAPAADAGLAAQRRGLLELAALVSAAVEQPTTPRFV